MKSLLLHGDREFDIKVEPRSNAADLVQDLELSTLFQAMAGEDEFMNDVVRRVLLSAHTPPLKEIQYRQAVLMDCRTRPKVIHDLYDLTLETLGKERKIHYGLFRDTPSSVIVRSIEVMAMFVEMLRKLRGLAERESAGFQSAGFRNLFENIERELSEEYLGEITAHLKRLKFNGGVLIGASLGQGNKGTGYTLFTPPKRKPWWLAFWEWITRKEPESYTFHLSPRDEAGAQMLSQLQDYGLAIAAQAIAEAVQHVLNFFITLRVELAFYIGCLNLDTALRQHGCKVCIPEPLPQEECAMSTVSLYDVCLALRLQSDIVGNTVEAARRHLIVVTGANQGGKSTFLRSVGQAQLMMQAGMFVAGDGFQANLVADVFTHYKREEDRSMSSGKFDEELARMSNIVDHIRPGSLMLFNESFASTNEREGSEIGRQIVEALLAIGVKVVFVTHMYELAKSFGDADPSETLFLRAQRERSFILLAGDPEPTSYGSDLYEKIFGAEARTSAAAPERVEGT